MHGSKTPLLVVAAAASTVGLSLSGCTVHNYPTSAEQRQQQAQQERAQPQPQAQAQAQTPNPARPPATRPEAPAPQKPAPQPAAAGRSYTIKPGDNLWNIAKEVYGDGTKYQRILDANPGLNPDNMKPGTKIVIP